MRTTIFCFRRKSSQPAMTWPPAVAVNSNHPELIAAASNGKKKKPGIIYLSSIPQGFNVSRTTGFFAQYGRVGRVYLQPGRVTNKPWKIFRIHLSCICYRRERESEPKGQVGSQLHRGLDRVYEQEVGQGGRLESQPVSGGRQEEVKVSRRHMEHQISARVRAQQLYFCRGW